MELLYFGDGTLKPKLGIKKSAPKKNVYISGPKKN